MLLVQNCDGIIHLQDLIGFLRAIKEFLKLVKILKSLNQTQISRNTMIWKFKTS
jgi:catalase